MSKNSTHRQPVVMVVGDLMVDHYIWGDCTRISPEAPVQVVNVKQETENLGGSLNVINNLVSLGATVYAAGVIGDDMAGKSSVQRLQELRVNTEAVVVERNRPTTLKSRVLASNHQIIRIDKENTSPINNATEDRIVAFIGKNIALFDIIILSDYGKGVLTQRVCQEIIGLAKNQKTKVLVDPKGTDYSKYYGAYLITPNKKEASLA
jgi:D-beta-D-heptose 7-phosphate kinase/D-beta-D-heptose 1-phosphate adenosyltransferase